MPKIVNQKLLDSVLARKISRKWDDINMGLRSIREIFITGHGPSSSHTMGPFFACRRIVKQYQDQGIMHIQVTLYGSLALTGAGHLTDQIIDLALHQYPHEIELDKVTAKPHPNTMEFVITTKQGTVKETIRSIGGGTILSEGETLTAEEVYPHQKMEEIYRYCQENDLSLYDYVARFETEDIQPYFEKVLTKMDEAAKRGLEEEGILPGKLRVHRKAKTMYEQMLLTEEGPNDIAMNVAAHAFAVAEENASGGVIVTAPTCGSAGVIPGCIQYLRMCGVDDFHIIRGLMVAGLFGIVCKMNASVSGAEAGCQAEIGVACSMGAGMIAFCFGKPIETAIQAAEIALEHSLGLTCDPVDGYVQVPCIERCAVYALKAIDAVKLATIIPASETVVSYDDSIATMMKTGLDMDQRYKETSLGGLATTIKPR